MRKIADRVRDKIKAVFFDMGGTIEEIYYDQELREKASRDLLNELEGKGIDLNYTPDSFLSKLESGMREYKEWAVATQREASPERIISRWLLPDLPFNGSNLYQLSEFLVNFWETRFLKRTLRPEIHQVIPELKKRGLQVGIISNTQSYHQVECSLKNYKLADQVSPVVLSSSFGRRKPHPAIFWEAAKLAGVAPEESVYVGDTISRDVVGAAEAGYYGVFKIESYLSRIADKGLISSSENYRYIAVNSLKQIPEALSRL